LYKHLLKLILIGTIVLSSGCGYKPSAKYARKNIGQKISTSVIISAQDPENTVLIKDSVDSAIIEIFHSSLVDKEHSTTHLTMSISEPTYTPIQYNNDGYVIAYRAIIKMKIVKDTKNSKKIYNTSGTYDFSVVPNAVLTDQERFVAIKNGATKAISSFLAKVSAEGSRK
jgi:hypothetical protein